MTTPQHTLYAGGYAAADRPGIQALSFDEVSGALAARGTTAGVANPSYLVVHPSGRWLYAVSETSRQQDGTAGAVWAVAVTAEPGHPALINHQPSGGDWPCHLAFDASGRWLVVANYGSGTVEVLPIRPDGALGEPAGLLQHHGHGPNPARQDGPHTHSTTFAPDGRFALVADLGIDALVVYAFDPATGRLADPRQTPTAPGAGPRHLAFAPDGRHLYVANELANTVAVYDYAAADGALHERQTLPTLPPGAPENTVADIHVAPAGDRVYVSNRGHDSIACFAVEADGRLAPLAIRPSGGRWPRNFAIAPGGRFLLVANQYSDEVTVLPVLPGAEALGAPVARVAVSGASCVQFAPNP